MNRLMRALGHPEQKFPAIHVAGTNGKGSVCALMASVLKEAGLKTGMYTSPHLRDLTERFQINGRPMSAATLTRLTRRLRRALRTGSRGPRELTQFEFLTTLAFMWFAEQKVDVAVVEVGLGGRLDATNVLRRVWCSVITNIDLDHTNWLGKTVEKIAREKAGIIKPRTPVVTGAKGVALKIILRMAKAKRAPAFTADGRVLRRSPLHGAHQEKNLAVALAALEVASQLSTRFEISDTALRRGLEKTVWPGRFEEFVLRRAPRRRVILDGAHNPAAMRALREAIRARGIKTVDVVFGALRDKDYRAMISVLAPVVEEGITVCVPSDRTAAASDLAAHPAWRNRVRAADSIQDAWKASLASRSRRPLLVTGSLYLVGEVRNALL